MNIVILKERMKGEGRVALTPAQCVELLKLGHIVYVESGAGEKAGYMDEDYSSSGVGVSIFGGIIPILQHADTIVLKVKQPLPKDDVWLTHMRNGTLFAYFHSTGEKDRRTIDILLKNNITAISYEIVEKNGTYPILIPMSEIAGRLAVEWGIGLLEEARAKAKLCKVENQYLQMVVFGAGTVGFAAIKKGADLGFSSITVFEKDPGKERFLHKQLTSQEMERIKFFSLNNPIYNFAKARELQNTDLLVGAVLVPGGHAPIVVSEAEVNSMSKGSVIVDVACDQGGCIWHPERIKESIFGYQGKAFCRTPNMPGSVPLESTPILAKSIFPYLLEVADNGAEAGFRKNVDLRKGLLTHGGKVMNEKAAAHWGEEYTDPDTIFSS